MNKSRFEAFSDGVFAFAITLLVLGIALPKEQYTLNHELQIAIYHLWPSAIAYVLSFAVIGLFWHNHNALFRLVEGIDRTTVFLNLGLLAGTVLIPFVTKTLGSNPTMSASTFLYGAVLTFCATLNNLMLMHLVRGGAFYSNVGENQIAQTVVAYRTAWGTYAVATLLAIIAPIVSFIAYFALVLYFFIPRGVDADI